MNIVPNVQIERCKSKEGKRMKSNTPLIRSVDNVVTWLDLLPRECRSSKIKASPKA